jgi:hypothetical protein
MIFDDNDNRLHHDEVAAAVAEIKAEAARRTASSSSNGNNDEKSGVRVISIHDDEPAPPRLALVLFVAYPTLQAIHMDGISDPYALI